MLHDAALIGYGVVGEATSLIMGIPEKNCYSKQLTKKQLNDVARKRYIYICLPTPTVKGKTDLGVIEKYVKDITSYGFDPIFIIRSTVPVGTCQYLAEKYQVSVASSPEFLSENTALKDAMSPDFTLLGIDDVRTGQELTKVYDFMVTKFLITDTKTAEMIKYATNVFYATKVVFANVIYDICQKEGVPYERIKDALYASRYIGKNHLDVYHKGYRGAGGKCLGKDLDSFAHQVEHPLFTLVNELNKRYLNEKLS